MDLCGSFNVYGDTLGRASEEQHSVPEVDEDPGVRMIVPAHSGPPDLSRYLTP